MSAFRLNACAGRLGALLAQLLASLMLLGNAVHASEDTPQAQRAERIEPGERLSTWMLRQPRRDTDYALALAWNVPAQKQPQAQLKHFLIAQLAAGRLTVPQEARQRLAHWLSLAPVTGRAILPSTDPRWLQAHPEQDPVLDYDQRVILPRRPDTVMVFMDDGTLCPVHHRTGAEAAAYIQACRNDGGGKVDQAWIVQPDGNLHIAQIADWNAKAQDEPAPGAWIWAPSRQSGWTSAFSTLFAEFLATQPLVDTSPTEGRLPVLPQRDIVGNLPPRSHGLTLSASDWGLIGLLQTPTARMSDAGEIRMSYSQVAPYGRLNVIMQPFDWLEAGFRYTDISNRLYGAEIAGTQSYKDKSVDFKLRLLQESANTPEIAFGITDIGGTGLFSSEYLVANKRFGDFDFSLGLGWGYLGGANNIKNPLSKLFGQSFDTRPTSAARSGGTFNSSAFFHGNTSLFGGIQYQTPWPNIALKLEYDGNNYQNEPLNNPQHRSSPINVGVVYRYSPNLDLTLGMERGDKVMLSITLHGALDKFSAPKVGDPPKPRVFDLRPNNEPNWAITAGDISYHTKWTVRQISRDGGELRLLLEDAYGVYWKERIDRLVAILHRDAPANISRFVLTFAEHGINMTERVVLRDPWVQDYLRYQATMARFESIAATEPYEKPPGSLLWRNTHSPFNISLAPSYQHNLGGPDGFILFQAGVALPVEWRLGENTWISGRANARLIDNYGKFKYDAPSELPRVRTDLRQYLTTSRFTLPNLQINHIAQVGDSQYFSFYAGALESMFAGVGTEWLYRPWHKSVAFGVDINHVRQRDFHQNLSLRDYQANTGHATLYWDTGWQSTHINLSVGQYLAGDKGATIEANRTFRNGVTLGAWATKTNVSSQTFGEGSFDKGIYVRIPFDTLLPVTSPAFANLTWNPLTRDGGARLDRSNLLYDLTSARNKRLTRISAPGNTPNFELDDERPLWGGKSSMFDDLDSSFTDLGNRAAKGDLGHSLVYGGALVLGASILDRPLSKWAENHQTGRWNTLGKTANTVPYILAAGTGILWLGAGGDLASDTAWTAIKSAALSVGVETLTKFAVGRSRPDENLGPGHFAPMSKGSANSSFPSLHTGVAFSLVTPFARRYDAPWLYSIAGITSFGRIQQRQHFASDVVAGGLIGFGIGALMLDEQQRRRGVPQLSIGADRVIRATWQLE